MKDRDELEREGFGEAVYQAWRAGMDPDRVDRDRIPDHIDAGALDEFDVGEMETRRLQEQDRQRDPEQEELEQQETRPAGFGDSKLMPNNTDPSELPTMSRLAHEYLDAVPNQWTPFPTLRDQGYGEWGIFSELHQRDEIKMRVGPARFSRGRPIGAQFWVRKLRRWRPFAGDCHECGDGLEVLTESKTDGEAFDGDRIRCIACGEMGNLVVGEDGSSFVSWHAEAPID